MNWKNEAFAANIDSAVGAYDRPKVEQLCDELIAELHRAGEPYPYDSAKSVLGSLRRKRYFDILQRVADAFIQNGQARPRIRRQYAQSLLDQSNLSAAITYLQELIRDTEKDPAEAGENVEARGLLGRAYKQVFVDIGNSGSTEARSALNDAIRCYRGVHESDPSNLWHGINSVALLMRAAEDSVPVTDIADPRERARSTAQSILNTVRDKWDDGNASMWDMGTATEACVALSDVKQAVVWLERYVAEPKSDAFELASTLRQLTDVWRLRPNSESGAKLLPLLRGELLAREGGKMSLQPGDPLIPSEKSLTEGLEKVLGKTRYVSYKFMLRAVERGKAVARIERDGFGVGTGFLVRGGDLHQKYGDEMLVMTNAHVVSDDRAVANALRPEEAEVVFHLLDATNGSARPYNVKELLWTSPPWELDATLLRLDSTIDEVEPYPVAPRLPLVAEQEEQRIYIIGHPKGGPLAFSIQDNLLLDHEGPPAGRPALEAVVRLHYRAPTDPGSSGSPVFNRQWRLIALHHAGGFGMQKLNGKPGSYPANEGIWIQSIRAALESHGT